MKIYTVLLAVFATIWLLFSINRSLNETIVYLSPQKQQVKVNDIVRMRAFIKTSPSNQIYSARTRYEYDPEILEFIGAVPIKNCDSLPHRLENSHDLKNASIIISQSVNPSKDPIKGGTICFTELAFKAKQPGTGVVGVSGAEKQITIKSVSQTIDATTTQNSTAYILVTP